eukprot:scpid69789/ scgid13989/ 
MLVSLRLYQVPVLPHGCRGSDCVVLRPRLCLPICEPGAVQTSAKVHVRCTCVCELCLGASHLNASVQFLDVLSTVSALGTDIFPYNGVYNALCASAACNKPP